jgi:lysophospholipid acyltransferase (LPLAT)-like uncharacterized protein
MVPYPLGRGIFIWGEPLRVPREADGSEMEAKRRELEASLNRISVEADEAVLHKM